MSPPSGGSTWALTSCAIDAAMRKYAGSSCERQHLRRKNSAARKVPTHYDSWCDAIAKLHPSVNGASLREGSAEEIFWG